MGCFWCHTYAALLATKVMKTVLKQAFLSCVVATVLVNSVMFALAWNEISKLKTAMELLSEFSKTDLPGGVELPGL